LFGCLANIIFVTKIHNVSLPAYNRRALVLAARDLLCNALLHAFPGDESSRIEVGLTDRDAQSACLRVAGNGAGFNGNPPNLTRGVAAGLAGLLEADLAYERTAGWTVAEIVFPVRGS
jgi:two-component sensor histidine kinase